MTKKELAKAYGPELSEKAAGQRLNRWIHLNPDLMDALFQHGYQERSKILSPIQVKLIEKFLGEP